MVPHKIDFFVKLRVHTLVNRGNRGQTAFEGLNLDFEKLQLV